MKKNILKKSILFLSSLILIFTIIPNCNLAYASSTHLKKTTLVLTLGETYTQKLISAKGKAISYKSIKWKSKNKDIATISKSGKIVTKKTGTTEMTARCKNKTYKFTVKIKKAKLNSTKKSIYAGQKTKIKLYNASNKQIDATKLTFKTSNKNVATISKKGVVTGKKPGKATITVVYKGKKYKAKITVKSNFTQDKTSITLYENETKKILITATEHLDSIYYKVVEGLDYIDPSWSEWNGDKIHLEIKGLAPGTAKIKIYDTYNESDYKYLNIKIKGTGTKLERMAADGINEAYICAKYPSTLHIKSITYSEGEINGYGDTIDRMVISCYAANSLGGYGDLYVVVLRCDSGDNYPDWNYYPGYGYISATSFSAEPGAESTYYDNETALNAYQKFYNTDRFIPYD